METDNNSNLQDVTNETENTFEAPLNQPTQDINAPKKKIIFFLLFILFVLVVISILLFFNKSNKISNIEQIPTGTSFEAKMSVLDKLFSNSQPVVLSEEEKVQVISNLSNTENNTLSTEERSKILESLKQ